MGSPMPPRDRNAAVSRAFGHALKVARVQADLSRADISNRTGIPVNTVGRFERGEREPSLEIVFRLARAADTTAVALIRATEQAIEATGGPKPTVAACYIVRDGRLLMVRRRFREGTLEWAGPSGNIHPGESAERAAVRETMEEVGIEIEPIRILGHRVHPATGRHLIYVACRYVSGAPRVADHEEVAAVEWVPIPEALERWANLTGGVYPPVREYLVAAMAEATRPPTA
jgi:8-oxo-dGTP diphosphatase